jgi:biopolymer transport protein ExbB/TolQ
MEPHTPNAEPSLPRAPAAAEEPSPEGPSRLGDNLDLLKALLLAVFATAACYEIFPLPFIDQRAILSVFDNWVSETIVAMTFWSLFLLLFKYREHHRQSAALRAFVEQWVSELWAEGINARNADALSGALRGHLRRRRVRRFEQSAIFRRVQRVLHYVRALPRKEGIHELLDYQAQIDVKKLDASYTVLHVFLWAIPILGFIGTVLGIAQAVNEFAAFIQTAEAGAQLNAQMRAALAGVTAGLGVAFNTTFLALVLVIPVMLITSLLQKSEEELLLGIEEYCLEELLPRLSFVPASDAVAETFEEHLHRIQRLSATWLGQFEPLIRSLGLQVDMIRHQMTGIQPLIKEFTDRLIDASGHSPAAGAPAGNGPTEPPPGNAPGRAPPRDPEAP